jgi:cysteine desulfurase
VRIPVTPSGVVDLEWIRSNIRKQRPAAVVVMAANNETGVLQPWDSAQAICRENEIPFVCDATQWIGRLPSTGLGKCDWLFGSAHKSGGPKGIGFLKCAKGEHLRPLIYGGGQQEHRRAGTENVASILSWEAALKWCEQQLAKDAHIERNEWRAEFIRTVCQATNAPAPNADVDSLWNTVSLELPAPDCRQLWTVKLDRAGYAVSSGSACASGDEKPSHVLLSMNRDNDQIRRTVRVSSGWQTTRDEWRSLAATIETIWRSWPPPDSEADVVANTGRMGDAA